jgi:very-short-patch-repair endonuclease
VSREQLRDLGVSRKVSARMLAAGLLREVYPGVYVVGHRALTPRGWLMAAVLAGGPGAVASHRSAAWLHGLLQHNRSRHDVTPRRQRQSDRIDFHRCRLTPEDVTIVDGIPCTTVARTILDLAEVVPPRLVERALDESETRRILDMREIEAVMERADGRRGLKPLRAILQTHRAGTTITRSELEERMLDLVRRSGLPHPVLNVPVGRYEADFLWPAANLIAEVDGAGHRLSRASFERDRRRDAELTVAGYRVVRFTWRHVTEDPGHVATTLRALLVP